MKITNKQICIKAVETVSSEYIKDELKKLGIDALRWAIVDIEDNMYVVNVSCIE